MTKASKKSNRSKSGTARESGASSYYFEDFLALGTALAKRRKDKGAEKISEFAATALEFANSVEAIPNLGNFVSPVVESLEDFADYIRKIEFDQIIRDSATFARRHPVFAIGGGILAGLIATQMLRSSGTSRNASRASNPNRQKRSGKRYRKIIASPPKKSNGQAHLNP